MMSEFAVANIFHLLGCVHLWHGEINVFRLMKFEFILIQMICKIVPIIPVVLVDRIDGAREEDGMILRLLAFNLSC